MDFKNGETITDYKMSIKRSSEEASNRLPVDRFIDQLIDVEDPKKEYKNSKKKDKKDKRGGDGRKWSWHDRPAKLKTLIYSLG